MNDRKLRFISALIASVLTFAVFLPSAWNGFVNWDDQRYVYENPLIRQLDFGFVKTVFTTIQVSNWHPLTMLSFAADYRIWGLSPFGYHLESIIIHSVNAFLAALLTYRLIEVEKPGSSGAAFIASLFAALLFGIHPAHVESVAWVSGRKDVLCAFFYISSLLLYLRYADKGGFSAYAASLVLFVFALMSKPMAVTLPMALLILDFYPLERLKPGKISKALMEKVPFFLAGMAVSIVTILAQRGAGAMRTLDTDPILFRVLTAFRGYIFYIIKMVFPSGLAPYYPYPFDRGITNYQNWGAVLLFAIITAACVVAYRKRKLLFPAVWAFYMITLLPMIGLIQVGRQAAADRYLYLAAMPVFILAGLALAEAAKKIKAAPALAIAAALAGSLSYLTYTQCNIWKDSVSLWSHEIRQYPIEVPMAYNMRGSALHAKGELDRAANDYGFAIKLNPYDPFPYNNLGLVLEDMNEGAKAIESYSKAISLDPNSFTYYNNRGIAFGKAGDYGRAIDDFDKTVDLMPGSPGGYMNRGMALLSMGKVQEALADLRKADAISPGSPAVYYNLGLAYLKTGDKDTARGYLEKAAQMGFPVASGVLD